MSKQEETSKAASSSQVEARKAEKIDEKESSSSRDKDASRHRRHASHRHHHKSSSSSGRHKDSRSRDDRHRRSRSRDKRRKSETAPKKSSRRRSSSSSSSSSSSRSSSRHRRDRKDRDRRSKSRDRHRRSPAREATSANKYMPRAANPPAPAPESQAATSSTTSEFLKSIQVPKELSADPVQAAKYQMELLKKKAEEMTGVKVPSFYNATAINPLVYAEQQRKRKLLWSKAKDNENTTTKIVGKAIVEGQDEKTAEKFRKLMGIKDSPATAAGASDATDSAGSSPRNGSVDQIQRMQKQAFEALDKEYAFARMATHTHRGMGLGFATQGYTPPAPK